VNRQLLLMVAALVIGSRILAAAAEPNTTDERLFENGTAVEAADPKDKNDSRPVNVITVKAAEPTANNSEQPVYVTIVKASDPKATKVNVLTAREEAKTPANNTPFAGKIVRVQMTGGTRNEVFVLENVKLTTLKGGSEFLVGTCINDGSPYEGLKVHLNLRLVASYIPMTPKQWKHFSEMRPRRPSTGPFNPPAGNNPRQGGPGPFNPPQGGQGPFIPFPGRPGPYTPPQGGQGPFTPFPGGPGPNTPPQGGPGAYTPSPGGPGPYIPFPGGPGQNNSPQPPGYNPRP